MLEVSVRMVIRDVEALSAATTAYQPPASQDLCPDMASHLPGSAELLGAA